MFAASLLICLIITDLAMVAYHMPSSPLGYATMKYKDENDKVCLLKTA
jgi:hypothetical protein